MVMQLHYLINETRSNVTFIRFRILPIFQRRQPGVMLGSVLLLPYKITHEIAQELCVNAHRVSCSSGVPP